MSQPINARMHVLGELALLMSLLVLLSGCRCTFRAELDSHSTSKSIPSVEESMTADGIPASLRPRLQADNMMAEGKPMEEFRQALLGIGSADGMMEVLALWGGYTLAPGEEISFNPTMVPYTVIPAKGERWDNLIFRAVRNNDKWPGLPAGSSRWPRRCTPAAFPTPCCWGWAGRASAPKSW